MSKTMPAVVFHGEGRWSVEKAPQPVLESPDDVLLEVDRAGICGTDLHILETPPGHPATPGAILGHEYVATVAEIGSNVANLAPGDRVVIDPNLTCGNCSACRQGRTNGCENMTTLGIFRNGGLAKLNVAPAKALHKISSEVAPEKAALAEPLSCVLHAFEKAPILPGESIAILGGGPIGLLFLLLFRNAGASAVYVVEPGATRREMARKCGADAVFDPGAADLKAAIGASSGKGVDLVVDAVGRCFADAIGLVRPGGRILLFGMDQTSAPVTSPYEITRREITVIGSFIQRTSFPKVVRILEAGRLPVEKLITHQLPLAEFGKAIELLGQGQGVKILLEP
jgi:2-desacetyl-2-hydroxyethyl bacteriochlorophyllide A dehydrogenase